MVYSLNSLFTKREAALILPKGHSLLTPGTLNSQNSFQNRFNSNIFFFIFFSFFSFFHWVSQQSFLKNSVCVPNQSYTYYVSLLDVLFLLNSVSLGVTQNCWIFSQAISLHGKLREMFGVPHCAYINMCPSLQAC